MKQIIFLILLLFSIAGAQTHNMLDERAVVNFNHNWDRAYMDTLHLKPSVTDTLVLTGSRSGYNLLVYPLAGNVNFKLESSWSLWWLVEDGSPFSISGGEIDTLFLTTPRADSSTVQVIWTSFK